MKFGNILFPYSSDSSRDAKLIAELLREAQVSDELGFESVWLAEHHFSGICPYADPVSLAVAIAATTQRIKIGFAVLQASFHHPIKLAEQLSFLDNLSRGRLIVGLGRGNMGALFEYDAYGVAQGETVERLIEVETLLAELWTQRPSAKHEGKYWQVTIPALRPEPFTKPYPLMMRSVVREESYIEMARANRPVLANYISDSAFSHKLKLYRQTMSEMGYSDDEIAANLGNSWTWRRVFVAETDAEAERVGLPAFRAMLQDRQAESDRLHAVIGLVAPRPPGGEDAFIVGSPGRVAEEIAQMEKAGIGGAILQFRLGAMPSEVAESSMRLFAEKVAPMFQRAHKKAAATA